MHGIQLNIFAQFIYFSLFSNHFIQKPEKVFLKLIKANNKFGLGHL